MSYTSTIINKNFETSQKGDNVPLFSPLVTVEGPGNIADSTLKGGKREGEGGVMLVAESTYLYNSLSQ